MIWGFNIIRFHTISVNAHCRFFFNLWIPQEKEGECETNSPGLQVAVLFWTLLPTMTRPPMGRDLPVCCYGANNKVEAMHSCIQDDDSCWCMPHTHFILEIRTDVNMGKCMSHSLCWKPWDLYRLKWDTFITTVTKLWKDRERHSQNPVCVFSQSFVSFCSFITAWLFLKETVCLLATQFDAIVSCNAWKYCASFGL